MAKAKTIFCQAIQWSLDWIEICSSSTDFTIQTHEVSGKKPPYNKSGRFLNRLFSGIKIWILEAHIQVDSEVNSTQIPAWQRPARLHSRTDVSGTYKSLSKCGPILGYECCTTNKIDPHRDMSSGYLTGYPSKMAVSPVFSATCGAWAPLLDLFAETTCPPAVWAGSGMANGLANGPDITWYDLIWPDTNTSCWFCLYLNQIQPVHVHPLRIPGLSLDFFLDFAALATVSYAMRQPSQGISRKIVTWSIDFYTPKPWNNQKIYKFKLVWKLWNISIIVQSIYDVQSYVDLTLHVLVNHWDLSSPTSIESLGDEWDQSL
jgi:hypothetical protein